MTYDFDNPDKFEDDYDATAAKNKYKAKVKEFELNRNNSQMSAMTQSSYASSVSSYVSNLSLLNKTNLGYFGKSKKAFLVAAGLVF
jgi:hypothetical protein